MLPISNLNNMELLLELAVFIRNKKSTNPITILSVMPNNEEAEKNLAIAKKNLESLVKIASANETKVNIIATLDHNIAGGIIRTSREIMSDTIMIGWPRKTGLIERFIETKTSLVISRTSKAIYICHFEHSLVGHKRLVVVCPPLGELEHGFDIWLSRVSKLSRELSINIFFFCNEKSRIEILEHLRMLKIKADISFSKEFELQNLEVLHQHLIPEDLLIYIAARKTSVSHDICMENIQEKLEKQFPSNSRIIIYPRTYHVDTKYNEYGDISSDSLNQGLERVQKIRKELGNFLKRENKEN
jgi:hypothetical protein